MTKHFPESVPTAPKPLVYCRTAHALDAALGEGKLAIMGLSKSRYYTTNAVGRVVWEFLVAPHTREEIRDHVIGTYHVAPEVCEKDIDRFLQDLLREGLAKTVTG